MQAESTDPAGGKIDRRSFARTFYFCMAASMVDSAIWKRRVLAEVRPPRADETGSLVLKLSDYPALAADFGAVRIGTSALSNNLPTGLFYPILINRAPNNVFHVLSSQCTHEDSVVRTYSRSSNSSVCPRHGSVFGIDGRRISGLAQSALRKYSAVFDGKDRLEIALPDMAFAVEARVNAAVQGRLEIEFLGFANVEYEVFHRSQSDAPWDRVPFASTREGPLTLLSIKGNDNYMMVYLESANEDGFFQVAMKTRTL